MSTTMSDSHSIETQVFTWSDWQQDDTTTFGFYDVVLVVPVGPYPAGAKFAFASWNGENSTLGLYEKFLQSKPSYVGKLKVTVE
jgi:hypothetical protein